MNQRYTSTRFAKCLRNELTATLKIWEDQFKRKIGTAEVIVCGSRKSLTVKNLLHFSPKLQANLTIGPISMIEQKNAEEFYHSIFCCISDSAEKFGLDRPDLDVVILLNGHDYITYSKDM